MDFKDTEYGKELTKQANEMREAHKGDAPQTSGKNPAYVQGTPEWEARQSEEMRVSIQGVFRNSPVSIRGLDYNLYTLARSQAIREGKNIGEWLNDAIREKLSKVNPNAK